MNSEFFEAGLPPANDRMLTTCFLAALFHGIVILGVTFSSTHAPEGGTDAPALEVLLVDGDAPGADKNPDARYISQRTQVGAGNMLTGERTLIPRSSAAHLDRPGVVGGAGAAFLDGSSAGEDEILAARAPLSRILYFAPPTDSGEVSQVPELLEKRADFGMAPNDEGIELRLRGQPKQQLWIAADTRESDVAVYLDGWRRKVEHVGTRNFPDAARRKNLSGTPVIEVTIGADGRLLATVVRRSSGHPEIDDAAMRILKLAAPYDPFPATLRSKHDEIRIAYEWQFLGGAARGSSVLYGSPDAAGVDP